MTSAIAFVDPTIAWSTLGAPVFLIHASRVKFATCAAVFVSEVVTRSLEPSKVTAVSGSPVRRPGAPSVGAFWYVPS